MAEISSRAGSKPGEQPLDELEAVAQQTYEHWVSKLRDHLFKVRPEADTNGDLAGYIEEVRRLVASGPERQLGGRARAGHAVGRDQVDPRDMQLAGLYVELLDCELAISQNVGRLVEVTGNHKPGEKLGPRVEPHLGKHQELVNRRDQILERIATLNQELEEASRAKAKNLENSGAKYISPLQNHLTTDLPDDFLNVINAACYFAMREALEKNTFQFSEDTPWPTAPLNRGGIIGNAQLVPPLIEKQPLIPPEEIERWVQIMWKQREELSDLDADALDLLCHTWLKQARKPEDSAVAVIDELLALRNLKPKQGGQGRRGGYEPEQRTEMLRALSHIQSLWINMGVVELYEDEPEETGKRKRRRNRAIKQTMQSRAFVVTDRLGQLRTDGYMDVERFIFQPGKLFAKFLFGPGRQTALLSAKAIQYDPYRQKWEKRLARYLSWQWRIQVTRNDYTRAYRTSTLIEAVGMEPDQKRPGLTRDRLEKALDRLQADGVIAQWQYEPERWNEEWASLRGWLDKWLASTIIVEPPEPIRESYKKIEQSYEEEHLFNAPLLRKTRSSASYSAQEHLPDNGKEDIAVALQTRRKQLGLSQMQTAELLGIGQSYLSKLEKGRVKLTPDLQKRINAWLYTTDQL